jgi:hypothetical protein
VPTLTLLESPDAPGQGRHAGATTHAASLSPQTPPGRDPTQDQVLALATTGQVLAGPYRPDPPGSECAHTRHPCRISNATLHTSYIPPPAALMCRRMVLLPSGDTAPLHTASTRAVTISLVPIHVARPMRRQHLPTATTAASGSTSVRPSANGRRWQIHTNHEGARRVTPRLVANRIPRRTRGLGGVPRHLPNSATTTTHLRRLTCAQPSGDLDRLHTTSVRPSAKGTR